MSKLSNIPSYQDLTAINYLLLVIEDSMNDEISSFVETLRRICRSRVFNGKAIDFKRILELSKHLGLVVVEGALVFLTPSGVEFAFRNIDKTYELSSSQEDYIIENFLFGGWWKSNSRNFFLNFVPNYKLVTFEFVLQENSLPKRYVSLFSLFKRLGVVSANKERILVNSHYVKNVKELLGGKKLSQDELRKLLDADEQLGLRAEEAVLIYEINRLEKLGRLLESKMVRRISQLDVAAGYDIESFDGDNPGLLPNRFIEVKASRQGKIRFYWSSNEYKTAKELGENYWIYFLGNFSESNGFETEPVLIKNPIKLLQDDKKLKLSVSKYLVEEI